MLTIQGIETRLRKLEAARRPKGGVFFPAWRRDKDEIERAVASARAGGSVGRGDTLVRASWTAHDTIPALRWIGERDLSWTENEALGAEMERRYAALAALYSDEEIAEVKAAFPSAPPDSRFRQMSDEQLFAEALGE